MITRWKAEWSAAPPIERTAFALIAIAAFLNVLLGALNYPVIGHGAGDHLNWLDQFTRLTSQGIFYPRWLPDSFGGFGSPAFYFYPPLVYWVASCFHAVGIYSPSLLYNIVQLFFSILSFITCYAFLRQGNGNRIRSVAGALLFSFLSYRFCDVYVRDAFTEHAALAFVPMLFIRFPDRLRAVAGYAVAWTGLFLTSLPIAYLSIVSLAVVLVSRRSFKEIPLLIFSFLLAVAACAVSLFPVFGLRGLIHQRHLFDLPMHASQFGFALLDLVQGHFDWLRILSIATIIASFPLLFKEGKSIAHDARGWSSNGWKWLIAVAIFFQIPFISAPLWHLIPGMSFVQFSWRWNGILLLAIAVLCSGAVPPPIPSPSRKGVGTAPLRACILIGLALITILSELTLSRNLFVRPPLPINSYRMDAPEYAPKWASNDPAEVIGITLRRMSDPPAQLLGLTMPDDSISIISKTPIEWNFSVHLQRATPVRFHQFYWPYWKLYKDSTEIPLSPDANGFATAELPAGHYSIVLKLEKSGFENTGLITSLFGFSILSILLAVAGYRSIIKDRDTTSPPEVIRKI